MAGTTSHPPCEDVSWKTYNTKNPTTVFVILLVRMWVEKFCQILWCFRIYVILLVRMWVEKKALLDGYKTIESSSLWGCELKSKTCKSRIEWFSHPPCEDVSWKRNGNTDGVFQMVILLVRMWVEKPAAPWYLTAVFVILLVRMWVEKLKSKVLVTASPWSSSLWGCELKIKGSDCTCISFRSSSLWGCELKNVIRFYRQYEDESSSLWGCELKNVLISPWSIPPHRHPPCEDVSWKTRYRLSANWRQVILLVRMWVEKIILRTLTVDGLVILLVRMWVEKDMQMISPFTYTSSSLWGCELKR